MIADEYYNDIDEYIDNYYGNTILRIPMLIFGVVYNVMVN